MRQKYCFFRRKRDLGGTLCIPPSRRKLAARAPESQKKSLCRWIYRGTFNCTRSITSSSDLLSLEWDFHQKRGAFDETHLGPCTRYKATRSCAMGFACRRRAIGSENSIAGHIAKEISKIYNTTDGALGILLRAPTWLRAVGITDACKGLTAAAILSEAFLFSYTILC